VLQLSYLTAVMPPDHRVVLIASWCRLPVRLAAAKV